MDAALACFSQHIPSTAYLLPKNLKNCLSVYVLVRGHILNYTDHRFKSDDIFMVIRNLINGAVKKIP